MRNFRNFVGSMIVVLVATLFTSALAIAQGQGGGQAQTGGLPALQAQVDAFDHPWTQYGTDVFYDGGEVGIGTADPSNDLHVIASGDQRGILVEGENAADRAMIEIRSPINRSAALKFSSQSSLPTGFIMGSDIDNNGGQNFFVWDNISAKTRFLINSNGNVDVNGTRLALGNTTSVQNQLTIRGGSGEGGQLILNAAEDGELGERPDGWSLDNSASGDLRIFRGGGGGGTTLGLKINTSGDVTGAHGNYHVPSDQRLKKNIRTISSALNKVVALRGVNFRWIDGTDNDTHQMGMIAQEVERVVPEVVHTANDDMKTKAIEYQYLVGLLVEAIKEQQAQIEQLKSEKEILRENVSALTSRQDTLETMFLALSTTLPKEKLVKLDRLNSDEVQKSLQ